MATKGKTEKNAALPETEDGTNIGERNTAGGKGSIAEVPDAEREQVPGPTPASQDDPEIEVKGSEAPEPDAPDTNLIHVTGTVQDGRIAFFEVNFRHPGGQVVVIGKDAADVAPTFRVMDAIADGRLKR